MFSKIFAALIILYNLYIIVTCNINVVQLPHCIQKNDSQGYVYILYYFHIRMIFVFSYIFVSTLDGKFSALDSSGALSWVIDTGPGSLLESNIHNIEVCFIIWHNLLLKRFALNNSDRNHK